MLDIDGIFYPAKSVQPFRNYAYDWTEARDHYLSGSRPYATLVAATRSLLRRSYPRLKRLEMAYTDDRETLLIDVMATTDSGERYPLPSFDDRLPHDGPPWYELAPFNERPEFAHLRERDDGQAAFDEAGQVVTAWFRCVTSQYADFQFLMLALAFIARDSEGELTELAIR